MTKSLAQVHGDHLLWLWWLILALWSLEHSLLHDVAYDEFMVVFVVISLISLLSARKYICHCHYINVAWIACNGVMDGALLLLLLLYKYVCTWWGGYVPYIDMLLISSMILNGLCMERICSWFESHMMPMVFLVQEIYKFLLLKDCGSSSMWRECADLDGMRLRGWVDTIVAYIHCIFFHIWWYWREWCYIILSMASLWWGCLCLCHYIILCCCCQTIML